MKLILDFDDVLFNAAGLKVKIFKALSEHGIANGALLYEGERNSGIPFSLKRFLYRVLEQNPEVTVNSTVVYEEIMSECKNLVNQEIASYVQSLGKENCYIVTNGDAEFQEDKIARTEIDELVKQFTVVPGSKKEEIEALCRQFVDEQIVFVDDKSKFFEDLDMKAFPNLTTVEYLGNNAFEFFKQKIESSQKMEQEKLSEVKSEPQNFQPVVPKMV